jgi:molecular chaperone GrpE
MKNSEESALRELLRDELQALQASRGAVPIDEADLLPAVDQATLLGEMAALKAEVRSETTAARQVREQLDETVALLGEELERGRIRERDLRERLAQQEADAQRSKALALVALADRLEPALQRARELARPRRVWFWVQKQPAAVALLEGLELTASRLQDQLVNCGIRRLEAVGQHFDPHTMQAVATVQRTDLEEGTVVEEVTPGYLSDGAVAPLRTAEVVVNEGMPSSPSERPALLPKDGAPPESSTEERAVFS